MVAIANRRKPRDMAKFGLIAVLVLCAGAASAAALPSPPPLGPEGESAAANPAGDGVNACLKYLGLISTRLQADDRFPAHWRCLIR